MSKAYLDSDMEWFEENRTRLLTEHRGKWAVIFQGRLLGTFPTFSEAFREGVRLADSTDVLIQPILDADEAIDVSMIDVCLVPTNA